MVVQAAWIRSIELIFSVRWTRGESNDPGRKSIRNSSAFGLALFFKRRVERFKIGDTMFCPDIRPLITFRRQIRIGNDGGYSATYDLSFGRNGSTWLCFIWGRYWLDIFIILFYSGLWFKPAICLLIFFGRFGDRIISGILEDQTANGIIDIPKWPISLSSIPASSNLWNSILDATTAPSSTCSNYLPP